MNDKLDISGFGILVTTNEYRQQQYSQYILTGITENTNTSNDQRNQLVVEIEQHQTEYKLSIRLWCFGENFETNWRRRHYFNSWGNQNDITEVKENKPFSINQTANVYYTLDDKNIFAARFSICTKTRIRFIKLLWIYPVSWVLHK